MTSTGRWIVPLYAAAPVFPPCCQYLLTESFPASRIVAYHLFNGSIFAVKVPCVWKSFVKNHPGLTRELLDLLVLRSIDLRGIEIDPIGRIVFNFASS